MPAGFRGPSGRTSRGVADARTPDPVPTIAVRRPDRWRVGRRVAAPLRRREGRGGVRAAGPSARPGSCGGCVGRWPATITRPRTPSRRRSWRVAPAGRGPRPVRRRVAEQGGVPRRAEGPRRSGDTPWQWNRWPLAVRAPTVPGRAGGGRPGAARRAEPAAGEVPPAGGPLPPARVHPAGSRDATRAAGRHRRHPRPPGAGPTPRSADPPRGGAAGRRRAVRGAGVGRPIELDRGRGPRRGVRRSLAHHPTVGRRRSPP